jgi:hypothetical protein
MTTKKVKEQFSPILSFVVVSGKEKKSGFRIIIPDPHYSKFLADYGTKIQLKTQP